MVPDVDGRSAIPHKSRVKVQFTKGYSGARVDRVPAYIKWAKAEEGKMGATYDGYYWDPPANEQVRLASIGAGTAQRHAALLFENARSLLSPVFREREPRFRLLKPHSALQWTSA